MTIDELFWVTMALFVAISLSISFGRYFEAFL